MTEHLERLFSAAYDGDLVLPERELFDRHLAGCAVCASGYAEFTTTINAVRELPPARMPRPVRLPEGLPGRQRRPSWTDRLLGWRGPMIGIASVAAAVLVVVTVYNRGSHPTTGSIASSFSTGGGVANAQANAPPCTGSCPVPRAAGPSCIPQQLNVDAVTAGKVPSGFNNAVRQSDGNGVVVLATPSMSYAPGESILVYSRFINPVSGVVDLPCTGLATSSLAFATSGGALVPLQPAHVAADSSFAAGGPILQVTVPVTAKPGDNVQLVVMIPTSDTLAAPRQVVLTVHVT